RDVFERPTLVGMAQSLHAGRTEVASDGQPEPAAAWDARLPDRQPEPSTHSPGAILPAHSRNGAPGRGSVHTTSLAQAIIRDYFAFAGALVADQFPSSVGWPQPPSPPVDGEDARHSQAIEEVRHTSAAAFVEYVAKLRDTWLRADIEHLDPVTLSAVA